ncbi:MAG: lysine--tRNA ligase [Candidatus Bathyarchaeia archaeon]
MEIIGRGTWYDKVASEIIEREHKLGRSLDLIRVESGFGASGIPHIGSMAEAVRNYVVSLAVGDRGFKSEFIVFSDNKDGLRKVPTGLPRSLSKYIGFPVTDIPDPFKCHRSFGDHMASLLLDALDKCGIDYTFMSAAEVYARSLLKDEIEILLSNAQKVGTIVKEETGQEKYKTALPYFPVCSSCGRIYTTKAYRFLPEEDKVLYLCEGMEIRGRWLEGCGHEGEADYTKGEGKIAWKAGEFAARWRALSIRFEAYGKDIADSVRVNDRISREILKYEPPLHAQYEMFLDKSGRKISKSAGNVFTPQVWFRYGSPQSLLLLTLKRFVGTRNISVMDIPQYMNEMDDLEDIYFGRKRIEDEKERAKLRGLYEYCWLLKPPQKAGAHVPYNLLAYLAKVAPKGSEFEFITEKLKGYRYLEDQIPEDLKKRIEYAQNWIRDFGEIKETTVKLKLEEEDAVRQLIEVIKSEAEPERIQSAIFDIARRNGIKPKNFFQTLYMILLGTRSGPRLGPYIIAMGRDNVIEALERSLK